MASKNEQDPNRNWRIIGTFLMIMFAIVVAGPQLIDFLMPGWR
jgi:hypothetical protein